MTATAYETTFQGYEAERDKMAAFARRHYIGEFKLKPRRVLDVACGNGFWGSIFAEDGFEVSGFDSNEDYIADGLEKWPELDLVVGDVNEPFPFPHRFPLVFCRTLPHFYAEDLEASIPILRRLLDATAGSLLLSFWTDESRKQHPSGFWLWAENDFRRIIEAAGGDLRRIVRAGGYLQMLVNPTKRDGVWFRRTDGHTGTYPQSFSQNGLKQLDEFLSSAKAVVPMREAPHSRDVISMRHDVDHSLDHALKFARWEAERGYRSSYYLLHTAPYYDYKDELYSGMREMVALGHEIGLHVNAVIQARAEGKLTPQDGGANPAGNYKRAAEILLEELTILRDQGFEIVGTAAHGDARCGEWNLSNLDIWAAGYKLEDFGLEYECYHRHATVNYLTDNGGRWYEPLKLHDSLTTHVLVHPIHWPVNE